MSKVWFKIVFRQSNIKFSLFVIDNIKSLPLCIKINLHIFTDYATGNALLILTHVTLSNKNGTYNTILIFLMH